MLFDSLTLGLFDFAILAQVLDLAAKISIPSRVSAVGIAFTKDYVVKMSSNHYPR